MLKFEKMNKEGKIEFEVNEGWSSSGWIQKNVDCVTGKVQFYAVLIITGNKDHYQKFFVEKYGTASKALSEAKKFVKAKTEVDSDPEPPKKKSVKIHTVEGEKVIPVPAGLSKEARENPIQYVPVGTLLFSEGEVVRKITEYKPIDNRGSVVVQELSGKVKRACVVESYCLSIDEALNSSKYPKVRRNPIYRKDLEEQLQKWIDLHKPEPPKPPKKKTEPENRFPVFAVLIPDRYSEKIHCFDFTEYGVFYNQANSNGVYYYDNYQKVYSTFGYQFELRLAVEFYLTCDFRDEKVIKELKLNPDISNEIKALIDPQDDPIPPKPPKGSGDQKSEIDQLVNDMGVLFHMQPCLSSRDEIIEGDPMKVIVKDPESLKRLFEFCNLWVEIQKLILDGQKFFKRDRFSFDFKNFNGKKISFVLEFHENLLHDAEVKILKKFALYGGTYKFLK